ncbi:hypothetical protein QTP70_029861, partial [Hemibagrus guttatus]
MESSEPRQTGRNQTSLNENQDLKKVFSKMCTTKLPPHCRWDCCIDLLPNIAPPKNCIYLLLTPETRVMEEYIEEALSSCLAVSGIYFIENKEAALYRLPRIEWHY